MNITTPNLSHCLTLHGAASRHHHAQPYAGGLAANNSVCTLCHARGARGHTHTRARARAHTLLQALETRQNAFTLGHEQLVDVNTPMDGRHVQVVEPASRHRGAQPLPASRR